MGLELRIIDAKLMEKKKEWKEEKIGREKVCGSKRRMWTGSLYIIDRNMIKWDACLKIGHRSVGEIKKCEGRWKRKNWYREKDSSKTNEMKKSKKEMGRVNG